MSTIAAFEIRYTQFLDINGREVDSLPDLARNDDSLIDLYRAMVLTRAFDAKAVSLQRTGRLGTYASSLGQEAIGVGVAAAMTVDDVLLPSFREHGAQLWRGVSLVELFQYWGGDERGNDFSVPREDFPVSIPVGSHAPLAVGVALAMRLRGEARAAVCMVGDGATSKGDFYEAINLSGVWDLPAVFVASNNHWAISVPRSSQTAARTLAQKAVAAGIHGEQVDGNDVIAVHHAVGEALDKARRGDGPSLIEAVTYRLGDHTTADSASRYRDDEIVRQQWRNEPIRRLRAHLTERGVLTHEDEERLLTESTALVESAAENYLAMDPPAPESMFDDLYATLPPDIVQQRKQILGEARSDA